MCVHTNWHIMSDLLSYHHHATRCITRPSLPHQHCLADTSSALITHVALQMAGHHFLVVSASFALEGIEQFIDDCLEELTVCLQELRIVTWHLHPPVMASIVAPLPVSNTNAQATVTGTARKWK